MAKKKTKMTKLEMFVIFAVASLVVVAVYVAAQYTSIPKGGHGADKVNVLVPDSATGVEKGLQQAIDDGDFAGGADKWDGVKPGNIWYNDGNVGIGTSAPQGRIHTELGNSYALLSANAAAVTGQYAAGALLTIMENAGIYGVGGSGAHGVSGRAVGTGSGGHFVNANAGYHANLGNMGSAADFIGPVCVGGVCKSSWPASLVCTTRDISAGVTGDAQCQANGEWCMISASGVWAGNCAQTGNTWARCCKIQ